MQWISAQRPELRYALAHGWRFLIILITISIYLYIYIYLSKHFRMLVSSSFTQHDSEKIDTYTPGHESESNGPQVPQQNDLDALEGNYSHELSRLGPIESNNTLQITSNTDFTSSDVLKKPRVLQKPPPRSFKISATSSHASSQRRRQAADAHAEIKRMLLLNGYPIMYIILWIPGLVNRILEASGKTSSNKVLAALQCSTQFVGFANALTYGLNREMRQILWRDLRALVCWRDRNRPG